MFDFFVNDFFWYILHKTLIAGLLILIILLMRQLFKKVPKGPICLFWILLSFQLLVPPLFESPFALIPEEIAEEELKEGWNRGYLEPVRIIREGEPDYEKAIELGIEPQIEMDGKPAVIVREDSLTIPRKTSISWVTVLIGIWITGTVVILLYGLFAVIRIRFQTAQSIMIRKRVFICDEIDSPFAFGLFNPRIYLPSGIPSEYVESVYRHEMMHIKRRDLFWRFFGYLLLAVYWINPLSWAAYHLLCRDIESACDEKAVRDLNPDQRALYCKALLECGLKQRKVYVSPVCFGETNVLERVKKVISYKKTKKWVTVVILMICMILGTQVVLKPAKAQTNPAPQQGLLQPAGPSGLQQPDIQPDPDTSNVYIDTELAAYAKQARKKADSLWDGETEIPMDSQFLGEIRLIDNDGHEIHYALFRQSGELKKQHYSYIWWAKHENNIFSAAQDTGILWQAPGLPEFYSYYGVADLQEFFRLVLKDHLDRAYDVEFSTVKELDLSAYTIQRPLNADEAFTYTAPVLNKKLQAYAEKTRLESNTLWDGKTEIPGKCNYLGEIWLDYGYVQIQFMLYEQEAILKDQPYRYVWWAQNTLHRGQIPYTRDYSEAKDTDLLWQAPGLSDFYSYYGTANVQEFADQVLMTYIRNGYDVLYNSVEKLDLSEYTITYPIDDMDWFEYHQPIYNKMLAGYAENMRMETYKKWDGQTEIPGRNICLGEIQMKHNGDHIQYILFEQEATLQGKEYRYLWWAKTTREYFVDEHCIRQYFETREADVLWQAPGLSDFYSYYGAADLEEFKNKVLMKDMQSDYDVIYNTVEDLDLSAYTYPRPNSGNPEYEGEYVDAYARIVRQLEERYGKSHEGGYGQPPYLFGLVMAKMVDFDQDGTPELLCAYSTKEGVVSYNYDIYAYDQGQTKLLYSGIGYDGCTDVNPSITLLSGNGRIYIRVSGGEWHWVYYTVEDHQLKLAADVYASDPYHFNGVSYGADSQAYQKAFDQFFGYPMTTVFRYEVPSMLNGRQGVYVEEVLKNSSSGGSSSGGSSSTPTDKQSIIENMVNIHADFEYPDLAEYALRIRKDNLNKWDFVDEIPTRMEYLGEIRWKLNSYARVYILFRQEAEFKGQRYSYIWWAMKDGEYDTAIGDHRWNYSEARDQGILWQAPGLSDYFSYYGVADEQAFLDQIIIPDSSVFEFIVSNSVKTLDLSKYSYEYLVG